MKETSKVACPDITPTLSFQPNPFEASALKMSVFFDLQNDSAPLSEVESKSIHKSLRDALKAWSEERLELSEQVESDG